MRQKKSNKPKNCCHIRLTAADPDKSGPLSSLRSIFLAAVLLLLSISCTEENIVSPSDELVMVQVDLQYGFEGHLVSIEFSGDEYFRAELSESVPLAGPLATFSSHLPSGLNRLYAFWRADGYQIGPFYEDSVDFQLDDAERYFLGIGVYADTLDVAVQDSAFLYM